MSAPTTPADPISAALAQVLEPLLRRIVREEVASLQVASQGPMALSVAEAAKASGLSEVEIRRHLASGALPPLEVGPMGTHVKISRQALSNFINSQQ